MVRTPILIAVCMCGVWAKSVPTGTTWANLAWGFTNGGQDTVDADTTVVDVDLFDGQALIAPLKAAGHTVICYFSAGSWESWRPDANKTAWADVKIGKMSGWDELWLDIRKLSALQGLMGARLDLAASLGCDGVEPDNTDCYDNDACWKSMANPAEPSGDVVTPAQLDYNGWLASYGHSKGLLVALKNTLDLVPQLHDAFDFAINEECIHYSECDTLQPFVATGKGILGVAYNWPGNVSLECSKYQANGISGKYCHGDGNICTNKSAAAVWSNCW